MISKNKKICLILGGSKGIGLAIAKNLLNLGNIVYIGSRVKEHSAKVSKRIDQIPKSFFAEKVDVNSNLQIRKVIKKIVKKWGRIDVVINTAGVFRPFGEFDKVEFSKHLEPMNTNLIGSMKVCFEVISFMKKQKDGVIILFSGGGVGGEKPMVNASSYYTSKGALAIFTEVLAEELKDFKIRVNAVLPGQILTDSTKATLNLKKSVLGPVLFDVTKNLKATGGGSLKPVLELINFLISDKGKKISGRLLSAKWDKIDDLEKSIPSEFYKLRRVEGKIYQKIKRV